MSEQYKHLPIEKAPLINDRRTTKSGFPPPPARNLPSHSDKLKHDLRQSIGLALRQTAASPDRLVFKFSYSGYIDLNNLEKHGVNFISQEDKEVCVVFSDEKGLAKFEDHLSRLALNDDDLTYKGILEALEGIDNWTAEDRTSWAIKNRGLPSEDLFKLDIELWPLATSSHPIRNQLCEDFDSWLNNHNIRRLDRVNLDSLLIYRLEATQAGAEALLDHIDVRLVDLLPETGIGYQQLNVNLDNIPPDLPSPDQGSAKVCILDSGINTNHPLLRSAVAETSSFITDQNEFDDVGHGTAVAGIALYGDLEGCVDSNYWRPELWLYSGKLLYQDIETGEARFDEKTIEQSLIRAVKYFAGDLGCKIFNVSIGNANSPYDGRHVRGIAYVLDKLARDYDVLFVVSAGNFSGSSEPPVPQHSWRDEYPEYLMGEASVIIDPAPALNVITVGSIAKHTANYDEQRWPEEISALSPACEDQPSPFTRHGPSVKGAVKPDLVATGGNLATPMRREGRQWDGNYRGLGVLTLNHDYQGNLLLKEISGTSFAAPYITHLAGRLLNEYPESSANLLRAMLINHASLPDACANTFSADYQKQYKKDKGSKHRNLSREVVGYGKVDADTLYRSTENEVILKAEDRIKNDVHQFYELPLPTNFLRRQRVTRELRITLSYSPPVRTTRQDYTASKMFFRLVRGESLDEIQRSFNYKTKDDVAPRSDDVDDKRREITLQIRDKGTVQSSTWTFRELKPTQKWFVVVTRQDRDWGQSLCSEYEPYALVVSVADRDNESAQLYQQIRSEIQIQQQVRNRT